MTVPRDGAGPAGIRIAVDLLGGDHAPGCVVDAIVRFHASQSSQGVVLVIAGPSGPAVDACSLAGIDVTRLEFVEADGVVDMAADPVSALRQGPALTAAVCAGLVAEGRADAWVSAGHSGACVAASAWSMGRLAGMTNPALAVVLPALHGRVVLADAGASLDVSPAALVTFALSAGAYARSLGVEVPRIGLLSIGAEPGKGDRLRKEADQLLRDSLTKSGLEYIGLVEGHDVASGERVDVVVCDGFTGNVLLKGIEGALRWSAARMGDAYADPGPALAVVNEVATSAFAGGLLLGVDGIAVVGHGAGSGAEIAACLELACQAVRADLIPAIRNALEDNDVDVNHNAVGANRGVPCA